MKYRRRVEGGAEAAGSWPLGHGVDFDLQSKSKRESSGNC